MSYRTIYSRFHQIAETYPLQPAVSDSEGTITFAELDRLADAIAARFYDCGLKSVGIVMGHGRRQIAAMLAVLKSGAAYVPAEPTLPAERIRYMMRTADVQLVIDDDFCRDIAPAAKIILNDRSQPDGVAYILYTSGTTGRPKGVMVENHSVVNYAEAFEAEFGVCPGDVMMQYSVCSFDIFVEEVFASLLNGVAVCVPAPEIKSAPTETLMRWVADNGVTIVDGFPYLLAEMNKLPEIPGCIRLIISGGDVLRANYISRLRHSGARIYNTYGPSECTVCSNYFRVDNAEPQRDGTFPIGRPVKGVEVRILNRAMREVPPGEMGEICIFGEGVSRGYVGAYTDGAGETYPPEQRNFVTLPDGTRFYRSGDVGALMPDGNMLFFHRLDSQVMILGRRVEPGEVENVLNESPEVERGVVRSFIDDSGLAYLVAYIVPRGRHSLRAIRKWLSDRLSDFMVPEFFVTMKRIPLTRRGKVDVRELPVVMKEGRDD